MRGTVLRYWTTERRKAGMVVMNLEALFYLTRVGCQMPREISSSTSATG